MNRIKKKLRSERGASLIMAIVFMMLCAFVGGSVLAAATANAGQLKALTTDQQAFLDQRSVLKILLDELGDPDDLKLIVSSKLTETYQGQYADGGIWIRDATPSSTNEIVIRPNTATPVSYNAVQECFFECFIKAFVRYYQTDWLLHGLTVRYENGDISRTIVVPADEDPVTDITVTDPEGKVVTVKLSCAFEHQEKTDQDVCRFIISFPENGQLKVSAEAPADQLTGLVKVTSKPTVSEGRGQQVITSSQNTYFSWNTLAIEKGGE